MKYVVIGFCLLLGCQPKARSATVSQPTRAQSVFTDSALYRARCKEADQIARLTEIPQKCTPRDQRVEVR
jgi:hypothetical protein